MFLTRFSAPPNCRRPKKRRRRGRPAIKVPVRLPRRPSWDDEEQVSFYVTELALISGGVAMLKAIEGLDPQDALMHMALTLLRRHRDQLLRARRAPRSEAPRLLWKASRLLPLAGRLAVDAARAGDESFGYHCLSSLNKDEPCAPTQDASSSMDGRQAAQKQIVRALPHRGVPTYTA
jgi:hypothetical protein